MQAEALPVQIADPLTLSFIELLETVRRHSADSAAPLLFEPVTFKLESTQVSLRPFVWQGAPISVHGHDAAAIAQALQRWRGHWFPALRFTANPLVTAEGAQLVADLGAAPADVIEDLLFRLSDADAREVRIG